MKFAEIVALLYPFCGDGLKNAEFVVALIDNFMEEPGDRDVDGDYNPLRNLVSRTLENFFSGKRPIGQKNATKILGHMDKERFAIYVDALTADALTAISDSLGARGFHTSALKVGAKCADLIESALLSCAPAAAPGAIKGVTAGATGLNDTAVEAADELASDASGQRHRFPPLKAIDPPTDIAAQEMPYVTELMAAYGDAEGSESFTRDTLNEHGKGYEDHFNRQRRDFYAAESVRQGTREAYGDSDPDQFEVLKDETYDGVVDVWEQEHENGFVRLMRVLAQAAQVRIDRCWLCRDTDWIGNSQKKGVCHVLVNDGKIKGWVKKDV